MIKNSSPLVCFSFVFTFAQNKNQSLLQEDSKHQAYLIPPTATTGKFW
jgi:hypothetical protein